MQEGREIVISKGVSLVEMARTEVPFPVTIHDRRQLCISAKEDRSIRT